MRRVSPAISVGQGMRILIFCQGVMQSYSPHSPQISSSSKPCRSEYRENRISFAASACTTFSMIIAPAKIISDRFSPTSGSPARSWLDNSESRPLSLVSAVILPAVSSGLPSNAPSPIERPRCAACGNQGGSLVALPVACRSSE